MNYMLIANEEKIAKEWDKYLGYTIRPLPSTVSYYEKWIAEQSSNGRFMLYGGTPEVRSIFQKMNIDLTIVDRSEKMVSAMGRLTHSQIPLAQNEKFLAIDWLHLNKLDQTFSCLIGDDAINMVGWENFETFLQNAYEILEKQGLFICHLLVKPNDEYITKNFFEVLEEYTEGKIKSRYDLASRLNYICYDGNDYSMGWQKTIDKIGRNKLEFLLPDFDFIKQFGLCNSKFYCPPKHKFEKLLSKYFHIEEIYYSYEHDYCLFEPIYILKKCK